MNIDEPLRATLKGYYEELFRSENALYGYPGSIFPSWILGLILPVFLFSGGGFSALYMGGLVLWLLAIFETFRQLNIKHRLLTKIKSIETELSKNSDLLFCGCSKFDGHFFSPKTEQLYNIKSDILFDHHPKEYYELWRSHIRPEPKHRYRSYTISTVALVLLNLVVLVFIYA